LNDPRAFATNKRMGKLDCSACAGDGYVDVDTVSRWDYLHTTERQACSCDAGRAWAASIDDARLARAE